MNEAKPFCISKKEVWEGYKRVKENEGAAGVDEQTIEDFEEESLQDLESDVVGQLLSATGQDGENTKEERWREKAGHSYCGRSHCATGGQGKTGAGSRAAVPC